MKRRLILQIACVLPIASLAATSAAALPPFRISDVPDLAVCNLNRILPGPSSRNVVVWNATRRLFDRLNVAEPGSAVIGDFPEEEGAPRLSRQMVLSAAARLEPLRWSARGQELLVRIGENDVGLLDADSRRIDAADMMDPIWQQVRIRAISHGSTSFYRDPGTVRLLKRVQRRGRTVRLAATIGPSVTFLAVRYGNRFNFVAVNEAGIRRTDLSAAFAQAPVYLNDRGGRISFLGNQQGYDSFLPYAMPLIDLTSGREIGRFGWSEIQLGSGGRSRRIDLQPLFNQLMVILDASANGDTIFALVDLERETRLIRIRGPQIRSVQVCEKRGLSLNGRTFPHLRALPSGIGVARTLVRLGSDMRRAEPGLFGHLYRPTRADGRLVIYFHGGPTQTLAQETVPPEVLQLAPLGISVLAVEYSGMLGGGVRLTQRLPDRGIRALREDMDAVATWIRTSGFNRVFYIGDSFGGVAGVIAAVDHPHLFTHIFLRAPLLTLRAPEQWVRRNDIIRGTTPPASQLEFEHTIYGGESGRARFNEELRSYVGRLAPSTRLTIYFGSIDRVSQPRDLPAEFRASTSVMVIPRTGHSVLGDTPAVLRDIEAKLGAN